jgi:hypothetical protein
VPSPEPAVGVFTAAGFGRGGLGMTHPGLTVSSPTCSDRHCGLDDT